MGTPVGLVFLVFLSSLHSSEPTSHSLLRDLLLSVIDSLSSARDPLPFPKFPICGKVAYHHGEFHSYPQRSGWDVELLKNQDFGLTSHGRSWVETSLFVQSWICFGFLESILEIHVDATDFVAPNGEGQPILTTVKLPQLVFEWSQISPTVLRRSRSNDLPD